MRKKERKKGSGEIQVRIETEIENDSIDRHRQSY